MIERCLAAAFAAMLILSVSSCAGPGTEPAPPGNPEDAAKADSPSATLVPSHEGPDGLPPGHPPVDGDAGSIVTPPPEGSGTGAAGLIWDLPAGWIDEPPSSNVRRAQYRAPGEEGDAECVVFYFGPGMGGDPLSNAARWASQFTQPDGRPSDEVMKTEDVVVGAFPVMLVEITGTYLNPMVAEGERPGAMLLGAIVRGPDANWFFKLTGPESTVRSQREAFEKMIRSLRAGP